MATRREFIKFLGASSAMAMAGLPPREAAATGTAAARPNLLLVLADQWRPSALEFGPDNDNSYAAPDKQTLRTPQLKAFADEGIRLDRCYATKPVCTPNRSALLTGMYPHQTGMLDNDLMLPPNIPCMPDVLKDAGYRTYYIGKWHMDGTGKGTTGTPAAGFVPPNWRRRGLDRVDGMNRGHSYYAGSFMLDDEGTVLPVPAANPSGTLDEKLADFEPHRQVELAMNYLEDHQANHPDRPFFIWLNFGPPHTPFTPPAPFDTYDGAQLTPRPNNLAGSDMTALANYFGLCEALDYEFGRLLSHLRRAGLADDTIVVFSSDHGEMMGSHGYVRKGQAEDESWRVPCIARWPGHIVPGVSDAPFSSTDLMPTLLALCGQPVPETVAGHDKSGLWCGQSIAETPVFGENEGGSDATAWRGIVNRVGGVMYKLILRKNATGTVAETGQLYDLDADPFELNNLAGSPGLAAVQVELETDLAQWRTRTGDTVWPAAQSPRAATSYPDAAVAQLPIGSTLTRDSGGNLQLVVRSQSRIFLTLQESPDLGPDSWVDVGSARHGNGNDLRFPIPEPPLMGIPRKFYRIKAEETLVSGTTDFVEGGDIAGASAADWTVGAPHAANPGTIGLDIVNGVMGSELNGQVITQLGGTILIDSGTASTRSFQGNTRYTLVGGIFRRTTAHVVRLGQNTGASDVEFNLVGGTLDLTWPSSGLVFMGTHSVLNVSGGIADITGNRLQLHTTSSHTDTPIIDFVEEGRGEVRAGTLSFALDRKGYINFQPGSTGSLTVTGAIANDGSDLTGTRREIYAALWLAGRLRYADSHAGVFDHIFQVVGDTLSLV